MRVSIVVISYNSAAWLPGCLDSLADLDAEIVVIDNASSDGSVEAASRPGVRVIANAENRGFAGAANQGTSCTSGDYLLFLNPDSVLLDNFGALIAALDSDPQCGAACGLLMGADGGPQTGFNFRSFPTFSALALELLGINRLWPGNPVNRRYRCMDMPLDRPAIVDQPPGACLLVRRTALEQVGGWDETFAPVWFEDVDLCLRLRKRGFHARFEPASHWHHFGAHSVSAISFAEKQFFWYRNLVGFVRKHFGSAAALALRPLICAGATGRWLAAYFSPGSRYSWAAYRAVMRAALTGVWRPTPPCLP